MGRIELSGTVLALSLSLGGCTSAGGPKYEVTPVQLGGGSVHGSDNSEVNVRTEPVVGEDVEKSNKCATTIFDFSAQMGYQTTGLGIRRQWIGLEVRNLPKKQELAECLKDPDGRVWIASEFVHSDTITGSH